MSDIGVKLTGDNSEFRGMLDQSVDDGGAFADKLTSRVGEKLFGMRELSRTIATALGINIKDIADDVARYFTDMSAQEEAAYKNTADLTSKIADLNIKAAASRNTDSENYQLAIQKEQHALNDLNDAKNVQGRLDAIMADQSLSNFESEKAQAVEKVASIDKIKAAELAYTQSKVDSAALLDKITSAASKQAASDDAFDRAAAQSQIDSANKLMDLDTQHGKATDEISLLVGEINAKRAAGLPDAAEETRLSKVRTDLATIEAEQLKQKTADAAVLLKLDQDAGKAAYDRLTPDQQLNVLLGQRADLEYNLAHDGADQIQKAMDFNDLQAINVQIKAKILEIDKADAVALAAGKATLEDTTQIVKANADARAKVLQDEIQNDQDLLAARLAQNGTEDDVTIALENQIADLKTQLGIVEEIANQYSQTFQGSADYTSMSTAALQGLKAQLEAQLNTIGSNGLTTIGNANINQDFGDWQTAQAIKARLGGLDGKGGITGELNLRSQVQAFDLAHGDAATAAQFGDSVTQRSLAAFTQGQSQTNTILTALGTTLNSISSQMASSGIFPAAGA